MKLKNVKRKERSVKNSLKTDKSSAGWNQEQASRFPVPSSLIKSTQPDYKNIITNRIITKENYYIKHSNIENELGCVSLTKYKKT